MNGIGDKAETDRGVNTVMGLSTTNTEELANMMKGKRQHYLGLSCKGSQI